jgi:hypothetical protein
MKKAPFGCSRLLGLPTSASCTRSEIAASKIRSLRARSTTHRDIGETKTREVRTSSKQARQLRDARSASGLPQLRIGGSQSRPGRFFPVTEITCRSRASLPADEQATHPRLSVRASRIRLHPVIAAAAYSYWLPLWGRPTSDIRPRTVANLSVDCEAWFSARNPRPCVAFGGPSRRKHRRFGQETRSRVPRFQGMVRC